MAQRMNLPLMCALLLASAVAGAEGLPDPTRPAIGVEQAAGKEAQPGAPRVQMIKLSSGRNVAVVDGQEVTVGSRVGDMRVIRITESEVVLKGKTGTEVLKLFAEVEKRSPATDRNKEVDASASRKAKK